MRKNLIRISTNTQEYITFGKVEQTPSAAMKRKARTTTTTQSKVATSRSKQHAKLKRRGKLKKTITIKGRNATVYRRHFRRRLYKICTPILPKLKNVDSDYNQTNSKTIEERQYAMTDFESQPNVSQPHTSNNRAKKNES